MFNGNNIWTCEYSAIIEAQTVKFILADRFDEIFIADLKESFEHCLRVDSGNTLTKPFNFNNMRGLNLAAPTSDSDVANAKYVKDSMYKYEAVKIEENQISGNYNFPGYTDNGITQFSMTQGGAITFVLPTPKPNVLNQIMVDIKTNATGNTINFGTDVFFDKAQIILAANSYYTIIWEYSNQLKAWVCGALPKGAVL